MDKEYEIFSAADSKYINNRGIGKDQIKSRKVISVKEMGDLLGLKKTERYWLVHKNVFETKIIVGKMCVDITSFESWYANQLKYKKVTGEEPGEKIREWTYSIKDISQMLGIVEANVYDLIKRESIETVVIDDRMRIPKKVFRKWYAGQRHYRTKEDRQLDAKIEEATLSFPQMAALLGVSRDKVYSILRDNRYRHYFEIIVVADKRRVTKESFAEFLAGQDQYRLCSGSDDRSLGNGDRRNVADKKALGGNGANVASSVLSYQASDLQSAQETDSAHCKDTRCDYISLEEATSMASMSRQAISRYAENGCFKLCRIGRKVRISRTSFERWLASRQEEQMKH